MKYYSQEAYEEATNPKKQEELVDFGCGYCWDRKSQKSKELFFLDAANNMRICNYCPYCGRKYDET